MYTFRKQYPLTKYNFMTPLKRQSQFPPQPLSKTPYHIRYARKLFAPFENTNNAMRTPSLTSYELTTVVVFSAPGASTFCFFASGPSALVLPIGVWLLTSCNAGRFNVLGVPPPFAKVGGLYAPRFALGLMA